MYPNIEIETRDGDTCPFCGADLVALVKHGEYRDFPVLLKSLKTIRKEGSEEQPVNAPIMCPECYAYSKEGGKGMVRPVTVGEMPVWVYRQMLGQLASDIVVTGSKATIGELQNLLIQSHVARGQRRGGHGPR